MDVSRQLYVPADLRKGTDHAILHRSAVAVTHISTTAECGSHKAPGNWLPHRPATPLRIAINSIFGTTAWFKNCNPLTVWIIQFYRGADKSLARSGRKQAQKHARDARDFNNIETRAVFKFFFPPQGKAPKETNAILTEKLACFLPGRAKDLSAPL